MGNAILIASTQNIMFLWSTNSIIQYLSIILEDIKLIRNPRRVHKIAALLSLFIHKSVENNILLNHKLSTDSEWHALVLTFVFTDLKETSDYNYIFKGCDSSMKQFCLQAGGSIAICLCESSNLMYFFCARYLLGNPYISDSDMISVGKRLVSLSWHIFKKMNRLKSMSALE
ncbi:hypothetical protein ACJX0J_037025, partial [Zea mays]